MEFLSFFINDLGVYDVAVFADNDDDEEKNNYDDIMTTTTTIVEAQKLV